jgi:hypothetical protein
MGNKNEGYLGGIMGGESRIESGGGGLKNTGILSLEEAGTQVVTPSNAVNASGLSLTDGLTLVSGSEVDHIGDGGLGATNSYEDSYITLPTGSGYVYAEVHMVASSETFLHQAVGLIKSASVDTNDFGHTAQANAVTVRRVSTSHYRHVGGSTLVPQTVSGRAAVNTYHFLANRDNGNVWIGITPDGSTTRWIRSDNTMNATWSASHPTFSGLDLSVYDTFYFQQYYITQSAWVNFGGNPLFDGQLSSGNDSSDWFRDPDASVSAASLGSEAASGPAETRTLPQLSWGGITGRSVLTEGSAPLAVDTYSTLNPNSPSTGSFSPGNLSVLTANSGAQDFGNTALPSSGKVYWEVYCGTSGTDKRFIYIGNGAPSTAPAVMYRGDDGRKRVDGTYSAYGATYTAGDVIGVAVDLDNGTVEFFKNGTKQNPSNPINYDFSAETVYPAVSDGDGTTGANYTFNFGQDATFNGAKSAGTYTDANGLGEFQYEPPAGFVGLYTTTEGSAAVPGDDNWNDVSLLIRGDTQTDLSSNAHTLTFTGATANDTSPVKFATGSLYFDGSEDYITVPDAAAKGMGSSDFTVEGWFNTASTARQFLLGDLAASGSGNSCSMFMQIHTAGDLRFLVSNGTTDVSIAGPTSAISTNTWHHIAGVRFGNTLSLYLDGVLQDSGTITFSLQDNAIPYRIGRSGGYTANNAFNYNGNIEDFRITKGVARYTEDFDPPTESFPTSLPVAATSQTLVNTGIFTLEEIYELTKST